MPGLIAPLVIVGGLWTVWAWQEGAYFGSVFYPGALLLGGLLLVLALGTRLRAAIKGPTLIALVALMALGGWTLLSVTWSPAPSAGVEDAQRAFAYAGAFVAGIWLCNLMGRRMTLVLWPVALAGAAVAVGTLVVLATGTDFLHYFHEDATLKFPLGYRNANGTFFFICLWPLLTLAADVVHRWEAKMLMIGASTLMIELAVLAQSRGSLPAAALSLIAFVIMSRRGLRAATYAGLAVLPVLPALPALLDVFQHGSLGPGLEPVLRDAAQMMMVTTILSMGLAYAYLRIVEGQVSIGRAGVARVSRIGGIAAIGVIVVGGAILLKTEGGPIRFLDQRVTEFRSEDNPDFTAQGARFGANAGSNRADFWRVSLDQGSTHPILGGGAGSFQFAYLRDRDSSESPNDPHSVEMLMLGELGLPGLLMFVTFVVAGVVAALRSRSLGPSAIAVSTGALAAGTQWLVHSSYDWFWHYPALTAPVLFLLGAACAPRLLDFSAGGSKRVRVATVAGVVVAMITLVPIYLSEHLVDQATSIAASDPSGAQSDLDRAADLDPLNSEPLLFKGVLLERDGEKAGAISAFQEAVDRQPDNYATHYFLARALASTDPAQARSEISRAAALNPEGFDVKQVQARLDTTR